MKHLSVKHFSNGYFVVLLFKLFKYLAYHGIAINQNFLFRFVMLYPASSNTVWLQSHSFNIFLYSITYISCQLQRNKFIIKPLEYYYWNETSIEFLWSKKKKTKRNVLNGGKSKLISQIVIESLWEYRKKKLYKIQYL